MCVIAYAGCGCKWINKYAYLVGKVVIANTLHNGNDVGNTGNMWAIR